VCYHRLDEEARSLGYYQEAQRVWPVNLDVISWLGAFHVRNEVSSFQWCFLQCCCGGGGGSTWHVQVMFAVEHHAWKQSLSLKHATLMHTVLHGSGYAYHPCLVGVMTPSCYSADARHTHVLSCLPAGV
jgi:hypothetical protein